MSTTPETTAFERGIDPMLKLVLPEKAQEILSFQADEALHARIEELATRSTEDDLTEAERAEYAGYVRANKFVAVLQRHARRLISHPS